LILRRTCAAADPISRCVRLPKWPITHPPHRSSDHPGIPWAAVTVVALLVVGTALIAGQAMFDVISVKENKDSAGSPPGMLRFSPDGSINAVRARPRNLILIAYQLPDYQLLRAPTWTSQTFYDIAAKPVAPVTRAESYEMLKALLKDRFSLTVHREARELSGFALVRLRPNELGPRLQASVLDCAKVFASTPRCRESALITVMSATRVSAMAVAVFPPAVGPQMTRMTSRLLSAKAALELGPGQLHDRRPAVHVVRRKTCVAECDEECAHLAL